jgi:hypothetical protein
MFRDTSYCSAPPRVLLTETSLEGLLQTLVQLPLSTEQPLNLEQGLIT